jgi:hypothetical protein
LVYAVYKWFTGSFDDFLPDQLSSAQVTNLLPAKPAPAAPAAPVAPSPAAAPAK